MASVLMVVLYLLGSGLDHLVRSDMFRVLPAAAVAFLVPGYAVLGFVSPRKLSSLERLALAVPLSLGLTAVALYISYVAFHLPLTPSHVRAEALTLATALSLASLGYRSARYPGTRAISTCRLSEYVEHAPLLIGMAAYALFHGASFFAYPFLPEADGYSLIAATRSVMLTGVDAGIGYRPFTLLDANAFSSLSGLDPTILFKYLIPLLLVTTTIPLYVLARRLQLSRIAQFVACLLPISIPVIFQETEYVRAQTFVILAAPITLWLLIRWLQERDWTLYGLAILVSAISLEFHEFSLLMVAGCLAAAIPAVVEEWKCGPRRVVFTILCLAIAGYPYADHFFSLRFGVGVLSEIKTSFHASGFRWWFINNYVNTDGDQLGWPGWQAALYYGYNLGLILPVLMAAYVGLLRRRPKQASRDIKLLPVWGFFLPAFFFAEISPRFGFAYLPDRAWLYVSIAICFFAVGWMTRFDHRRPMQALAIISLLSAVASVSVTVLKQGWVTQDEYLAARWLQANTPSSSQVISQTGNGPLINVYANRLLISDPQFFFQSAAQQRAYLATVSASPLSSGNFASGERGYLAAISAYAGQLPSATGAQLPKVASELDAEVASYISERQAALKAVSAQSGGTWPRPTYVLYSQEKFSSRLYGGRAWWRQENAYGANLATLSRDPNLVKVYSGNGVSIWQYKPSP